MTKRNNRRYPQVKFTQYMRACKDCGDIFRTEWRNSKTCLKCKEINESRRLNSMRIIMLKHGELSKSSINDIPNTP